MREERRRSRAGRQAGIRERQTRGYTEGLREGGNVQLLGIIIS